jgi:hypothetical protein
MKAQVIFRVNVLVISVDIFILSKIIFLIFLEK